MGFGSRGEMTTQFDQNWKDMTVEYNAKYGGLAAGLQVNSPFPDDERDGEPISAISSLNQRLGTYLRDDKKNGVQSSPMHYIFESEARAHAWSELVREYTISDFKGVQDIKSMEWKGDRLAYTVEDFTAGTGFRQYEFTNVRDSDMFRGWPPLEAVVARVERQSGNDINTLEYTTDATVEGSVDWDGVSDIKTDVLQENQTSGNAKWLAGGIKMSQELRRSNTTSERIMYFVNKRLIRARQKMTDEALTLQSTGVTTTKDVGVAGTMNSNTVVGIATSFPTKEYKVRTIYGRTDKTDDYLSIDRSIFAQNAGAMTTAGSVVGGDMYGDMGVMRLVFDVSTSQIVDRSGSGNNGIDADEFLGVDTMYDTEVYIVSGTDSIMEEDIIRSRAYELTWTIKYLVQNMVQTPLCRIRFE